MNTRRIEFSVQRRRSIVPTQKHSGSHDTPGRPTSSGSRQQKYPDQAQQTGSAHIDSNSRHTSKPKQPVKPRTK
jgi:hypothetical protein